MQIVIDIPNSDIPLKQNVITLDLHFIDGHICECTYPFKELVKGHGRLIDGDELVKHLRKDPLFDLVEQYGISGVIKSRPTLLEAEL